MTLYINIETKKEKVTASVSIKVKLTINSIDELAKAVTEYCVKNLTWLTVYSFNVVARLDAACNTIDKSFYKPQPLHIVTRKEMYDFPKGSSKGILVWSQDAIIF